MKILIATHHLVNYGGTEIYTFELARTLKLLGHDVCVYTKYLGALESDLDDIFVPVSTDIADYAQVHFDLAHVHHNITALEVRHQFPSLPIFYLSHGSQSFLEQPPEIELNISQYGAVANIVEDNLLSKKISKNNISLIYNLINEDLFVPTNTIRFLPHTALVISTKLTDELRTNILSACKQYSIKVSFLGGQFGEVKNNDLPKYINKADIVFTLGRGAMESMLCGRIPIILDKSGFDGMITPSNFKKLLYANFSGKVMQIEPSVKNICHALEGYESSMGNQLRTLALSNFSSKLIISQLIPVYQKTIDTKKKKKVNSHLVEYISLSLRANNYYGYKSLYNQVVRSKFYKAWLIIQKLKRFA